MDVVWILAIIGGSLVGGFALVIGIVALVFRVVGRGTSLSALAARFPERHAPFGAHVVRFARQSVGVGAIWYRRMIDVTVAPDGLHVTLASPWRAIRGEGAALVPWSALRVGAPLTWALSPYVELGVPGLTHVRVPMAVYRAAYPFLATTPRPVAA